MLRASDGIDWVVSDLQLWAYAFSVDEGSLSPRDFAHEPGFFWYPLALGLVLIMRHDFVSILTLTWLLLHVLHI